MSRQSLFVFISALLIIGLGTAGFEEQAKPKKKVVKKSSSAKASTSKQIVWYNMTDGYAKALKEKKMLVIDAYTDWCYWCKVMDTLTYKNAAIIKKMNSYFVAVKFNPEVNATHVINGQSMSSDQLVSYLSRGGRIPGYPTTFIWKSISDQNNIAPYSGYLDTAQFNQVMNKYIQE